MIERGSKQTPIKTNCSVQHVSSFLCVKTQREKELSTLLVKLTLISVKMFKNLKKKLQDGVANAPAKLDSSLQNLSKVIS